MRMSERRKASRALSEAQERYVECIADAEETHGHAHISLLANALGVKKPSVVQMTIRLEAQGIIKRKDKEVTLTASGRRIATDLTGRHELLQEFMEKKLQMSAKDANQEACRLEHVVSPGFMRGLRGLVRPGSQAG